MAPSSSPRAPARRRSTTFSRANPRVDVIFNSVSGTRDPAADLTAITAALRKSFARVVVWRTTPAKAGDALGRDALANGARVLVACGGDGTVAAVAAAARAAAASAPAAPAPVLGVVPRGTANALCAALDIPANVKRAAEMVAAGSLRRIDFPRVVHGDERTPSSMLLLCGIGLEAETVKRADRGMKRMMGSLAYAVAGIASIWQQQSFRTNIVLYDMDDSLMFAEGAVRARELHLTDMRLKGVTIANAAPATSVLAQGIGQVRPDDGLLEVVCISSKTPLGMVRTMLSMLWTTLLRTRERRGNVYGLRARKVRIECTPPQRIVIDGEDAGLTPITVELPEENGEVHVIAPKAGTVTRRRRRFSRSLRRMWRNIRGVSVLALTVGLLKRLKRSSRAQVTTSTSL